MAYKTKEQQREYQRAWVAKRRSEWLAQNGPCVKCGSWDDLHVDHVDPTNKITHNVWSWTLQRREAELAKCQVLCREHHEAKTAEENRIRNGGLHHGTEHMYSKYKCRCEPCRTARSVYRKQHRAKRKALGLPRQ